MSERFAGLGRALQLAARQDGALTVAQAVDAGLTLGQIRQLVGTGGWRRPFRGALLVPGAPVERGRVRAALLLRPGAVACGITAARMHGLAGLPLATDDEPVHMLARPGSSRTQPRASAIVVHWGPWRSADVTEASRMPVTSPVRTVADLVLENDRDTAVGILDAALHDRFVGDVDEVRGRLAGRPGAPRSERWLRLADGRAESPLETKLRLVFTDAGLEPEQLQWPVMENGRTLARLDFAWPSRMVCVEADGAAVHRSPDALYRDRRRQNLLVAAGWTVFRFTWPDAKRRQVEIVRAVAEALCRPPVTALLA